MIAAIVPAAGQSRRMGRPKLTLPVDGTTVIARVVSALREGGAFPVVVVGPPSGAPGRDALVAEAGRLGALVVTPDEQPPDMRASVELALAALEYLGDPPTAVLLAPADSPGLSPAIVSRVIAASDANPGRIVVPTSVGKRGHPVALPRGAALAIRELPAGVGVNALIAARSDEILELEVDDPAVTEDLDTPEDYRRWTSPR